MESICHLLFLWPSNADLIEPLRETSIAMDYTPVEAARHALMTLEAAGLIVPGVDPEEPMIAVTSKPESLRLYRGATPPSVNALLSGLRDIDRGIRTMSTDYEPGSFHPLSVLLEGRQHEIEQTARQMLAEDPDDPGSLQLLIEALRMQGKYDEALTRAKDTTDRWPQNAGLWSTLGMIQLRLDQVDDAIESLERCLDLDPVDRNSMVALAAALRSKGEEARAREWESKAHGLGGIGF